MGKVKVGKKWVRDPWRVYDLQRYAITSTLRKFMRREQVVVFASHRVMAQIDTYTVHNEVTKAEALPVLAKPYAGGAVQRIATGLERSGKS